MDDVILHLVGFDTLLHAQTHPSRVTTCRVTVMLSIKLEFQVLGMIQSAFNMRTKHVLGQR